MVGVELAGVLDASGVRPALAIALFRDGHLSLTRAARLENMSVSELTTHLSRLGISVVNLSTEEIDRDMKTLDEWLASS
jgi:predicted HTH domain antitoxin